MLTRVFVIAAKTRIKDGVSHEWNIRDPQTPTVTHWPGWVSIQQHFVKSCIQRDFRHPFMSSQFNSHYSLSLLSLSIQTQSQLVGVS